MEILSVGIKSKEWKGLGIWKKRELEVIEVKGVLKGVKVLCFEKFVILGI